MAGVFRMVQRAFGSVAAATEAPRAAFLRNYGQPLQIELVTTPPSILLPDQVRIQVQYCSLNSNDVKYLEGSDRHTLPYVPGYEFSGEVIETSNGDSDLSVGQRVVGVIPKRCGALTSQLALDICNVWPLPSEVSTRDAAALVCGHSTALLAFTEIRELDEDDVVLIIAGAGGFGLAAVDIAASVFKAKVIALADTEGKAGLLRDRGAFAAFKSDLKSNYKEIMSATGNKGVNLIYDAVGGPILNTVVKCLKDDGDAGMLLGTYRREDLTEPEQNSPKKEEDDKKSKSETNISKEVTDKLRTISLTDYKNEDQDKYYSIIEQTLQFCEDGLITAHVSQTFNLDQVNDAIEYIKGKMCTGKVLIKIDE